MYLKVHHYRQCLLRRSLGPDRTCEQVAWIPEPHCVAGRTLAIREDGTWTDGWVVVGQPGSRLPEQFATAHWRALRYFGDQVAAKNGDA